jgi:hypothetical protein
VERPTGRARPDRARPVAPLTSPVRPSAERLVLADGRGTVSRPLLSPYLVLDPRLGRSCGRLVTAVPPARARGHDDRAGWNLRPPSPELHRRHPDSLPSSRERHSSVRRQRPHVRIVPGAWLNQAIFESRNAEKCTIHTSYSASATAGEADEPCAAGAGSEGVLDSLTEAQEIWALRKMGYFNIGQRS